MENMEWKNDTAWNQIFEKYNIIEKTEKNGTFEISADQIKEFREPRLMTKFDSKESLPKVFKDNHLGILPIKRGSYIIGKFSLYKELPLINKDVKTVKLPGYVSTIEYNNITSEAISLNAALISGMLEDLIDEPVVPTISGRMGTGVFNYQIEMDDGSKLNIDVENSQMEIDGSYESPSKFIIVEAKNHYMDNFIIRQLYYPYTVWKKQINKEIIPVMLIKHDGVYNFYLYSFKDDNVYNSLELKDVKRYILDEPYNPLEFEDLVDIMGNIHFKEEDISIPFPQANAFNLVLDIINELYKNEMSKEDITNFLEYNPRQTDYYISAARYLGFVDCNDKICLNDYGKKIHNMNHKDRTKEIIKAILSHKPFYVAINQYISNGEFDNNEIAKSIDECRKEINLTTANRRTSTVTAWIKWILYTIQTFEEIEY